MKLWGKKILKLFKVGLALCGVIGTTLLSNVTPVYAEEIIHTHIWATKYDSNKHWEYCTVCDKTKNSQEHKYVDHWRDGKESCWHYNYSTRVCDCGYSYKYTKPHNTIHGWKFYDHRLLHYKACKDCGTWQGNERCKNEKGELNCKNPGTCTTCGGVTTKNNHYIVNGGKCRDCGTKLIDATEPKITYASDYSKATVTFTIKPATKELTLTGKMTAYVPEKNYTSSKWSSTKNSDDSYTYTLEHVFNKDVQRKSTYYCVDQSYAANYNGTPVYIDQKTIVFSLVQDKTAPTVTEVKQKDQATALSTIISPVSLSLIVIVTISDRSSVPLIVNSFIVAQLLQVA